MKKLELLNVKPLAYVRIYGRMEPVIPGDAFQLGQELKQALKDRKLADYRGAAQLLGITQDDLYRAIDGYYAFSLDEAIALLDANM